MMGLDSTSPINVIDQKLPGPELLNNKEASKFPLPVWQEHGQTSHCLDVNVGHYLGKISQVKQNQAFLPTVILLVTLPAVMRFMNHNFKTLFVLDL